MKTAGHRVLIFSGMTRMLDIVQDFLTIQKYTFERLDGSVRGSERFEALHRFSASGAQSSESTPAFVFLLSVRAGGQGLNLTQADTCIFLDSDFNPQVDLQAEDRVHRIGQQKPVLVLRFVSQKTVEEGILLSARKKAAIAQEVLGAKGNPTAESSGDDELGPRALLDAILVGAQAAIDAHSQTSPSGENSLTPNFWRGAAASIADAAAQCKDLFDKNFASCDWSRVLARHETKDEGEELISGGGGASYELEYQPLELASQSLDISRLQGGSVSSASVHSRRPVTDAGSKRPKDAQSADAVAAAAATKAAAAKTRCAAKWEAAGYISKKLCPPLDDDVSLDAVDMLAEFEEGTRQGSMVFVVGDVSRPSCVTGGRHYIMHCVDRGGSWPDRGVFKALNDAHGSHIKEAYELASKMKDLHLGDAHCIPLSGIHSDAVSCVHSVVLLVCLEKSADGSRSIEMSSFRLGIMALRRHCLSLASNVTFHFHTPMPPPPCPWYAAERVLRSQLLRPLPTSTISVYYFRRGAGRASSASASSRESQTSRLARAFFSDPVETAANPISIPVTSPSHHSEHAASRAHRQRPAPVDHVAPAPNSNQHVHNVSSVPCSPSPATSLHLFHGLKFALHQLAWGTASLQVSCSFWLLPMFLLMLSCFFFHRKMSSQSSHGMAVQWLSTCINTVLFALQRANRCMF